MVLYVVARDELRGEFLSLRFQSWVPPFRGKAVSWERHLAEWQGSESTACPWGSACRAFVLWRIQSVSVLSWFSLFAWPASEQPSPWDLQSSCAVSSAELVSWLQPPGPFQQQVSVGPCAGPFGARRGALGMCPSLFCTIGLALFALVPIPS